MYSILISLAMAVLTVEIEGVGTFNHYNNITIQQGLFTLTDIDCIHDLIHGDGFESPNVLRLTTEMNEVIPLASASISGTIVRLKPRYPSSVMCMQRVVFLNSFE